MVDIISVSLPEGLRARLDDETERQRRSRSSVVAEAVADYLRRRRDEVFGEAQRQELRENLGQSPGDRVRLSEELWRELTRGRELTEPFVASFDSFHEYEAWRRAAGRPDA